LGLYRAPGGTGTGKEKDYGDKEGERQGDKKSYSFNLLSTASKKQHPARFEWVTMGSAGVSCAPGDRPQVRSSW